MKDQFTFMPGRTLQPEGGFLLCDDGYKLQLGYIFSDDSGLWQHTEYINNFQVDILPKGNFMYNAFPGNPYSASDIPLFLSYLSYKGGEIDFLEYSALSYRVERTDNYKWADYLSGAGLNSSPTIAGISAYPDKSGTVMQFY